MLIGYKLLGNEALLPIKSFYNNGFSFRGSRRNLIEELKQGSENKNTKQKQKH